MTTDMAVEIFLKAFMMAAIVVGPMLAAALVVGLVVGVLQAATQVNEPSIAFLSKLVAVAVALAALGPWTLRQLVDYTSRTISGISEIHR